MRRVLAWLLLLWVCLPVQAQDIIEEKDRFYATEARHGMVLAGERKAAKAGLQVLEHGGNAVDAAVTTALALSVTLPRAGNLAGGGFMLIRDPQGQVYALDFREVAPRAATSDMYLKQDGSVDRDRATVGALAVGVPGTVAGLEAALQRFGTISFEHAVAPAETLARDGIIVTPWMQRGLAQAQAKLNRFESSRAVYLPNGAPPEAGTRFVQKELAQTLHRLGRAGPRDFYQGELAQRIVASIKRHGGLLTAQDLESYKAVWRQPVSGTFRGYTVYSMPPPSSGGVHLIQMLNILEGEHFTVEGYAGAAELHLLAEAMRSAYADRSRWLGDPDFTKVPVDWLTSKAYAAKLRAAIPDDRARKSSEVRPGQAPGYESPDTTHLSVIDDKGWAVSLTYTLNFSYGSCLVADGTGMLLNNEMDDFSAAPGKPNAYGLLGGEANSIEARKRPLSSMTPTLVQQDGKLVAALGAPGGSRIITAVFQVLLNNLVYGFNAQTSVSLPRIHHQWYPDQISFEFGLSPDTRERLQAMGHKLAPINAIGQVMLIRVRPDGVLEAGADPRRPAYAEGY
ncbi:MAG: gamma-glutamyltransferase [Candidatus Eremiobacteraeota bacterium]|nr:gamma-glutamyltransferase [Candidatus Eremiobacteraeota bacterium]